MKRLLFLFIGAAVHLTCIGQNPRLVKDIATGTTDGSPTYLTDNNGTLFFRAYTVLQGDELWKSDGTSSGTQLVKDIEPGSGTSNLTNLHAYNGQVFFNAQNGDNDYELYSSDGTTAGTGQLKELNPDSWGSPSAFYEYNGLLYFRGTGDFNTVGTELWVTDGTAFGTQVVKDIYPGASGGSAYDSNPGWFTEMNGLLYFSATDASGPGLWVSDGTANGTQFIYQVGTGVLAIPNNLTAVGDLLFFVADDGSNGNELWVSDGTSGGTQMVMDINSSGDSDPSSLVALNDSTLLFTADNGTNGPELWKSDGTLSGTSMVKDVFPGGGWGSPAELTRAGDFVYFRAEDGTNGKELWVTDGTTAGTQMVVDLSAGASDGFPFNLVSAGNIVYFAASDGTNQDIYRSDGTVAGTYFAGDTPGQVYAIDKVTLSDRHLYFTANDVPSNSLGEELWIMDICYSGKVNATEDTICEGQVSILSVVDYDMSATIQWQENTGGGWTNITGATSSTYNASPNVTTRYRAIVDCADQTISDVIEIEVIPSPQVDYIETQDSLCLNNSAITLTPGVPSGGSYNGPGVTSGTFDPGSAGVGDHDVVYTYTDPNGCTSSDTSTITVDACTGVDRHDSNGFKVYPNPADNQLFINVPIKHVGTTVSLIDLTGKTVQRVNIQYSSMKIDVSNLSSGLYFVRFDNGMTHRVVVYGHR